jgi:pimeloyl-ACP methyl ester carboxylesterase
VSRRTLALSVIVATALSVSCGADQRPRDAAAKAPPGAPVTQGDGALVGIGGGRMLFAHCIGSGGPTVVLEAGFGIGTFQWQEVQPPLARSTRVCSYDRAGTGSSAAVTGMRDARAEVADLRRLLEHVGAKPPYALVGHSYGGVVARVFAYLRPDETAGLVLIDTMGRDGRRRQLEMWPSSQAPAMRRQLAHLRIGGVDLAAGEALASRVATLGETPLAVVTAGREDASPRTPARLHWALMRLWNRMQDELARLSTNRVHAVALASNHDVPSPQTGDPAVVIRAVEAIVHAARDHARLPPCPQVFGGTNVRCGG